MSLVIFVGISQSSGMVATSRPTSDQIRRRIAGIAVDVMKQASLILSSGLSSLRSMVLSSTAKNGWSSGAGRASSCNSLISPQTLLVSEPLPPNSGAAIITARYPMTGNPPMALDLETVVKQLTDSGIIAAGKLENFIPPKAHPKTVEELVSELVKSKYLTTFQGQQVKAGKAKALILGNYTILDKIGAGGMGQVFKAQHRKMDRTVAIKMLPPAMTKDAAALARFEREVRAAAKLFHPNIVPALDADQANGVHFLVMEHVEGKDLSAIVKKNGPLPVGKAVNYILQAAKGLEFAHSKGVIHRDIKPANLLLSSDGVVKILDMGLARIDAPGGNAATDAELTGTGAVMGTVDYMAPEQALNTKQADARADIYSLGISLYYLIAGRAAYGGDSLMEKLVAHREQPVPSLQDVQANVPKQLDAVFKKMCAKRIEDRYQTMSEVVEALEGLGFGGSGASNKSEAATALTLSTEERKRLASKRTKKPLGSLTYAVASEKTKHLFAKIIGGTFATIIAPILVTVLIKYLQIDSSTPNPPVQTTKSSPTLNKINLLALVNPDTDSVKGGWRKAETGVLDSSADGIYTVLLPYKPPQEYELTVTVTRMKSDGPFLIGLVGNGDVQFTLVLDSHRCTLSGIEKVDGEFAYRNVTRRPGMVLALNQSTTIVCRVRSDGLTVFRDENELLAWKGGYNRFSCNPQYYSGGEPRFYLGSWESSFRVTNVQIRH
jgi:serine/threonine protein kinase